MSGLAFAALSTVAMQASALPTGPTAFCDTYPDAPSCQGALPSCEHCHETPPARNLVGRDLEGVLLPGEPRPLDPDAFTDALPQALMDIETLDSDEDGFDNPAMCV